MKKETILEESEHGGFYIKFYAWGKLDKSFLCPNNDEEDFFNLLNNMKIGDRIKIVRI